MNQKKDGTVWNFPWKRFKEKHNNKNPIRIWNIRNWEAIKNNDEVPNEKINILTTSSGSVMLGKIEKFCTKANND